MTKNEAIEWLKAINATQKESIHTISLLNRKEALHIAIQALEEIQRYQATGLSPEQIEIMKGHDEALLRDLEDYLLIGSVEECREAVEKMKPKKVSVHVNDEDVRVGHVIFRKGVKTYKCQCGKFVTMSQIYCSDCGQRLLWEE